MKLCSFEKEKEPQIVQRGGAYFAENAVLNLEQITKKIGPQRLKARIFTA